MFRAKCVFMLGTGCAEELCESPSYKLVHCSLSKGEEDFTGKSLTDRGSRRKRKETPVVIKTLGPQGNGLEVYTHVHICFPQSLTFLPSFLSPCESLFLPTPTVLSVTHTFFSFCCPFQSQHRAEAAREGKKQGKQLYHYYFFFHPVSKPITRTTTTITTTRTAIAAVLRLGKCASLGER